MNQLTSVSPTPSAASGCATIAPHDLAYDEARAAWNLCADLRPATVVVATTVAEVQAAVALATAEGLRIAPFTTGHLATALPSLQDTMLLRTELGHEVDVDPQARRARVPAGAVWEDVVDAVAPHGLAVAHGSSPDVGVIGYLLGGGLSFYGRGHGLACNHVVAFELVDADGEVRHVNADEHADLFWALRGGGGNFGVVTAVVLELLPYAEVFAGSVFWPIAAAPAVLAAWLAWTREAPPTVTTSLRLLWLPPVPEVPEPLRGVPVIGIDGIATDEADGRAMLARLHAAAPPMIDAWATMPSAAALRVHGDPEQPTPAASVHALLGELDEQAAEALIDLAGEGTDCPLLFVELRQLGAALASSPPQAGARGCLEGRFALFGIGCPMAPGDEVAIEAALGRLLADLAPWDTGRRYLNFDERGGAAEHVFDPATFRCLVRLRAQWDPQGRFVASHRLPAAADAPPC
jgi:FAD/FMN-containing dehydrogenase